VAWLVLVLTVAAAAGAARLGWLGPSAPRSYAHDEIAWLGARLARPAPAGAAPSPADAVRARLAALRARERAETGRELEQRAVAAIAASRELGRLRPRAPAEVGAVEEAVRQLALTLTAPEFRDLDRRREELGARLASLEARLADTPDEAEIRAVARALEPAVMADVSSHALRADLERAEAALAAAVRALTGATVTVTGATRVEYDELRGSLAAETRYVVQADGPLRITRVDARAVEQRDIVPSGDAASVVVLDRAAWPARVTVIGSALRPVGFVRLALDGGPPGRRPAFPVTVALGERPAPEIVLVIRPEAGRLAGVGLPRHAFHHGTVPGAVRPDGDRDLWVPAGAPDAVGPAALELVPATRLLRNAAVARVKDYLYTPNLAVALGCVALAALTGGLTARRRRPAPPAAPPPA
jgi:hypothetical protein